MHIIVSVKNIVVDEGPPAVVRYQLEVADTVSDAEYQTDIDITPAVPLAFPNYGVAIFEVEEGVDWDPFDAALLAAGWENLNTGEPIGGFIERVYAGPYTTGFFNTTVTIEEAETGATLVLTGSVAATRPQSSLLVTRERLCSGLFTASASPPEPVLPVTITEFVPPVITDPIDGPPATVSVQGSGFTSISGVAEIRFEAEDPDGGLITATWPLTVLDDSNAEFDWADPWPDAIWNVTVLEDSVPVSSVLVGGFQTQLS